MHLHASPCISRHDARFFVLGLIVPALNGTIVHTLWDLRPNMRFGIFIPGLRGLRPSSFKQPVRPGSHTQVFLLLLRLQKFSLFHFSPVAATRRPGPIDPYPSTVFARATHIAANLIPRIACSHSTCLLYRWVKRNVYRLCLGSAAGVELFRFIPT